MVLHDFEENIKKNDLAIQELSIRIESLNVQVNDLLAELKVSCEQICAFIENKENFTEENWEHLVEQKQRLDEKLKTELDNIRNPLKNKKTYSERKIQPHWLFVK